MNQFKLILLLLFPFFGNSLVYGQGWMRTYEGYASSVEQTSDGGYISGGETADFGAGIQDMKLTKTDANGDTLWTKTYGGSGIDIGHSVVQTSDGGYIFGGQTSSFGAGNADMYLVKTDASGNTLWTKTYGGSGIDIGTAVVQTSDGGYLFGGQTSSFGAGNADMYLVKTDANGDTLWTKTYGGSGYDRGASVAQTSDGGYVFGGQTNNFGANYIDMYLVKTDANGNTLWTKTYGGSDRDIGNSVAQTNDGGYIFGGHITPSIGTNSATMYLVKTDANGDTLWTKTYSGSGYDRINTVAQTNDGGYVFGGRLNGLACFAKTNTNGSLLWTKQFNNISTPILDVDQCTDGGYIGIFTDSLSSNPSQYSLLKLDSLGELYSNEIQGNVFHDTNTDCINTAGDINLAGIVVRAVPANPSSSTLYATTDSQGNYTMLVDSGTYTISVTNASPYYTFSCQANGVAVNFTGFYQPAQTIDFALNPTTLCPMMQVDISAPFIRSTGGGSQYTVAYCNTGTAVAQNVSITVDLDPILTVLGTSITPASQVGQQYTFNVGNVGVQNCGSFTIDVIADTSALVGQAICSQAHITPDSVCLSNFWNGPIMRTSGTCNNDTVYFSIQNQGALMGQPLQYYVYEDNIIFRTGPTNTLGTGATQQIQAAAAPGKTYRLSVKQQTGFPAILGDSFATVAIEGCNPFSNGSFNTGFVTNLSNGSTSPFTAVDCQAMIAAFDPNDKQAQPVGYGSSNYIEDYTPLDYKIRFQNTGTDTAFRVVIRDTISPYLDINSIIPGASNHAYTWRVYGEGILEFTFDNIMLPDSNVNEPASHGFVRFRINQVPNNPIGTVIENNAAIYFDYNAPIITNTTMHTIGEDFVQVSLTGIEDILVEDEVRIQVYPNPFHDQTTIKLEGGNYNRWNVRVYDLTGQEVLHKQSQSDQLQLKRGQLTQGIYIYSIEADGTLINTGKMIVR